jgi:uncharacterized membrane protein
MTSYEAWLLLHLIAVIMWAGGAFAIGVVALSAQRSGTPVAFAGLAPINAWLGPRVLTPAALAALLTGVLLVVDGPWTFGELWIVVGLAGFALSFLPGYVYLSPESKRIREAIAREGPGGPEVARRIRRVLLVSRTTTVILFLVVADMVLKPTGEDGWLLAGGGAVLALLVAGIALLGKTPPRAAPAEAPPAAPK